MRFNGFSSKLIRSPHAFYKTLGGIQTVYELLECTVRKNQINLEEALLKECVAENFPS